MPAYSSNVLHIALTAVAPTGEPKRDLLVRAGGHRRVSELADDLAAYLGLPPNEMPYGLLVNRTGEHLVPERRLDQVDLREGDIVSLLAPGETASTRESRRPLRRLSVD